MFTKSHPLFLALVFLTACRDPLPCPDCMDDDIADDSPEPDLPCGGADLMTDSNNCGSCGNECHINYEGTDWQDGACVDGECGPHWSLCNNYSGIHGSCGEVCAGLDRSCVAQGCSSLTGMLFHVGFDGSCKAYLGPDVEMTGSCDEPIPWEMTIEHNVYVMCCCE